MALRYENLSFLSDYGTQDEFVGVTHSVIADIAPDVRIIDLTHDIAAFDVRAGSLALVRAIQYVRPGVVLAVVDPGVGTDRPMIAVEVGEGGEGVLVGPDNGLLAPAVSMVGGAQRVFALTNEKYHLPALGPTFAGRDIMGPVAAHICTGIDLTELGDEIDALALRPGLVPLAHTEDDGLHTEVLWVDRYGNAELNVGPNDVSFADDVVQLHVGTDAYVARRVETFAALAGTELGLIVDSYGMLTIVLNQASAADSLHIGAGAPIRLTSIEDVKLS